MSQVVLVGADFEENLGVGMIAAAALRAGHAVHVVPFNAPEQRSAVAREVLRVAPEVVGLSIQFQHRASEFLELGRELRALGFRGHLTCGGQWPTLGWEPVLGEPDSPFDTVVLHEGEGTFVELLDALARGAPVAQVPGLAYRTDDGLPARSAPRRLLENLDELPFPLRYREHTRHLGVPFVPILGARGCWGSCSYCSITSFYRDARAHGGGKTLRFRSPENLAAEMARELEGTGGDAVFCFHDDTFLLPRPEASAARVRALREALDGYGVGRVGMIAKCRPDSLTRELARALREAGVLRLYVGVENASEPGADHLRRASQTACVHEALEACREADLFVCYNLLLFEPGATLEDVRTNVRFLREHPLHPVNFCRAEPYLGTPLQLGLAAEQKLAGGYLGFNYRLEDDRAELLFRVCASAFRQRNFDPDGVANRYMGLGYAMKLLEHFYEDPEGLRPALARRVAATTRGITADTADFLEEALALVESAGAADTERLERETALLGLRVAASDERWHRVLDELYADLEAFGARARKPRGTFRVPRELLARVRGATLGASLAAWASGALLACNHEGPPAVVPVLPDPSGNASQGSAIAAPAQPDATPPALPMDPVPQPMVVDPAPMPVSADAGSHTTRGRVDSGVPVRSYPMPPDPPPRPLPMDPVPRRLQPRGGHGAQLNNTWKPGAEQSGKEPGRRLPVLVDQWRNTTPRGAERSADLPLEHPPEVGLEATREGDRWLLRLTGVEEGAGTRWEGSGELQGAGLEGRWKPSSPSAQVRVAVRTHGGVAVVAARASEFELRALP